MDLWSHLVNQSVLWLALTIGVFLIAGQLNKWCRGSPLVHPVVVSLLIIILLLKLSDTSYDQYIEGAAFLKFLMGPAIVALAIPLYDNLAKVRSLFAPIMVCCVVGALTAALSAIVLGWMLGADKVTLLSMAPKSVTSPIAIGIADKVGGYGSLAAGLVLVTGAMGCLIAPALFRLMRIDDPTVRGFTLGVSAHAMGTAYAFEYGALAGAFSGLAMGLVGTFTAFSLPAVLALLPL